MRILADEDMEKAVVLDLRTYGHDVRWVVETNPSEEETAWQRLAKALKERSTKH